MLVVVSLAIGTVGFHLLSRQLWIDALLNSAMLLGGMGPVGDLGPIQRKTLRDVLRALLGARLPDRGGPSLRAGIPSRPAPLPPGRQSGAIAPAPDSAEPDLPALLPDAVEVTQRSHDDDTVGDGGRRHDHFFHVVLRDLRQPRPCGEDVDLSVLARNI